MTEEVRILRDALEDSWKYMERAIQLSDHPEDHEYWGEAIEHITEAIKQADKVRDDAK